MHAPETQLYTAACSPRSSFQRPPPKEARSLSFATERNFPKSQDAAALEFSKKRLKV